MAAVASVSSRRKANGSSSHVRDFVHEIARFKSICSLSTRCDRCRHATKSSSLQAFDIALNCPVAGAADAASGFRQDPLMSENNEQYGPSNPFILSIPATCTILVMIKANVET